MGNYLYLSLIPESLVASMLPPAEFGAYMATGTLKRPHGQSMFFQVKPDARLDGFDLAAAEQRCVPHDDGRPKHSVYLGVYRVLERVPREALGDLYLTTAHGKVLAISPADAAGPERAAGYHLYQELAPVTPLIASSMGPEAFCRSITDPGKSVSVPRICFADMDLGGMADDPDDDVSTLPYTNVEHIRDCLGELTPRGSKETKTVDRVGHRGLIYRCVKTGFYVGDPEGVTHYPYPSPKELEGEHYAWWRCANDSELEHALLGV